VASFQPVSVFANSEIRIAHSELRVGPLSYVSFFWEESFATLPEWSLKASAQL
jgi:hypothetical protein